MPRYLSLFKYTPEERTGFMKEKAAAREAALKLTIESAGGKLELFNWIVPPPLRPSHVWSMRAKLQIERHVRVIHVAFSNIDVPIQRTGSIGGVASAGK
jgi:hypothetical protein